MKFATAYSEKEKVLSPSGSMFRKQYIREITPGGARKLKPTNPTNTYEYIQVAAKGNLLSDIIARHRAGDPNAIGVPVDSFADITTAPKSLMDAQNQILKARALYNGLSSDVKQRYGNSFDNLIQAIESGEFKRKEAIELQRSKENFEKAQQLKNQVFSDAQKKAIQDIINGGNNNA